MFRIFLPLLFLSQAAAAAAAAPDPLALLCNLKPANLGKVFARAGDKDFPREKILQTFTGFNDVFGECIEFKRAGKDEGVLVFKEASQPLKFVLDAKGKILNVAFKPSFIRNDSFEKVLSGFEKSAAGLYATKGNASWFQRNENTKFSMGDSAFVFVENAYRRRLEGNSKFSSETVELQSREKFRTNSLFNDWPEGTKISADTLSLLMVRNRDRIAADLLIRLIGQGKFSDSHIPFFPSFGQLYQLYLLPKEEGTKLLKEYGLRGIEMLDLGERKFQLSEREGDEYDSFEAGWYASPKAICGAFQSLRDDAHLENLAKNTENLEFLYEFQGAFPSGKSISMLGKRRGESEWRCISFAVSPAAAKGRSLAAEFDRLRSLLDLN